ncbi:hypothetical protein NL108_016391 [Boleophthalmus pectinirostris]|nr:E3 ubiquitin-protein ligase TRIM39-like isoform X2 [Boleophthalmus pectinirostris]XP_055008437.1 E3 ubiquitin-protein ligase TRIM39-like isoform X2 [Boleophthalmus pectinirostris]KAJ0058525.1 hypothetical protein NL108_016391 [Boleophthalmus pectinirostris]
MSSTRDQSSEEMFKCSICLEVFSEPVSTPCGHNFCRRCISQAWDTDGPCTCPVCKEMFHRRPQLKINTLLKEVVSASKLEKKKSSSMDNKSVFKEVQCDVCSEPKLKALKSCLVCLSSFCESHLQPHLTVSGLKRHQLMEPVENLEDRMCPTHQRPLELFCDTDQSCVCTVCVLLEHKNHELLSLEEVCECRRSFVHMVEQRRQKILEIQRLLELSETEAVRERSAGLQVFTALMQSVQRSMDLFLEELQEKQSRSHRRAQDLLQRLKQEICDLEQSSAEAQRLSRSEDPLHFLQRCPALTPPAGLKEWSSVNFEPETCEGSVSRALSELKNSLPQEFNKHFKELASESKKAELRRAQQSAVEVTLDPDTAHPDLALSEDLKQVHDTNVEKKLPDSPLRFDRVVCVLGKQSFSSGRFYFEVQVKGKTEWDLGVAQESINRKGKITLNPKRGLWCIILRNKDEYNACAGPSVRLFPQRAPQKVGVFVDYGEGLVSFYDTDSADLLFSFTRCCFREKLFPFFSPGNNFGGSNSAPLVVTAVETLSRDKVQK